MEKIVLVGVLKNWRNFQILLHENWYHIPAGKMPKKDFAYLAFYQPLSFGHASKRIGYYGRVKKIEIKKRLELFPKQTGHLAANQDYYKITIQKLVKLEQPIKNIIPRRIIFGFTTLNQLLGARDILELYNINDTEEIMERNLKKLKIKFTPQYYELINKQKRFRLDFAIFCNQGKIALECDNDKAHNLKQQKIKDREKDKILRAHGWRVIRLTENQIIFKLDACLSKIQKVISTLGGQNKI
jgi:very-short-patch-repair endonuclease